MNDVNNEQVIHGLKRTKVSSFPLALGLATFFASPAHFDFPRVLGGLGAEEEGKTWKHRTDNPMSFTL